jgi:hypothetical protein
MKKVRNRNRTPRTHLRPVSAEKLRAVVGGRSKEIEKPVGGD